MVRYAVSDIHGCLKSFLALLDKIAFTQSDELYILGDYIDRGPESKGVIDAIWKLQKEGYAIFCLKGNHDQMMLLSRNDPAWQRNWFRHGGLQTVKSFGTKDLNQIPKSYFTFLENLPTFIEVEEYILVHAGLNFDIDEPLTDEESMMWIRNWEEKTNKSWLQNRIVLYGHTPLPDNIILKNLDQLSQLQTLGIDNGCVYKVPVLHRLCAFDMTNRKLYFQKNVERPVVQLR